MENEIFYHYFSGNKYSIKNLQEGNITFSHINYFNDPCEIALLPDEELFVTKNSDMRYKYEVLVRVFCFSQTFKNPLMWGHYGNSHEGFCVGYDKKDIENIPEFKDNICFGPVNYSDKIPSLSDEEIIHGHAVFYKSSDWKNEQEWRASICLPSDERNVISESEFLEARKKWIEEKIFFEKAVDSHLRFPVPLTLTIQDAEKRVNWLRQRTENFEVDGYAYSPLKNSKMNQKVYGKYPMRIECSLKAKVIYVGLRTPDYLRKVLKEYAKANGIEIYEMAIEEGKYSFTTKKIMV